MDMRAVSISARLKAIGRESFCIRRRVRTWQVQGSEARLRKRGIPDPLKSTDGTVVGNVSDWRKVRRAEILDLFQRHIYGRTPLISMALTSRESSVDAHALGGLATRKEIRLVVGDPPEGVAVNVLLYAPNQAPKPCPAFVGLNFGGNHTISEDPGVRLNPQWQQLSRTTNP